METLGFLGLFLLREPMSFLVFSVKTLRRILLDFGSPRVSPLRRLDSDQKKIQENVPEYLPRGFLEKTPQENAGYLRKGGLVLGAVLPNF